MASLYNRPTSAFWWVKFRDPATGKITRESTKCRVGIGSHTRRAREICGEKTRAENRAPVAKQHAPWEVWVPEFLNNHYATKPKTLLRYQGAWKSLHVYLEARGIAFPAQLTYKHATDYVEWRQKPTTIGLYWASRATAIWELKILRLLMSEAVRQGLATSNPCVRLGLKKGPTREKPEITDVEIGIIRQALKTRPEWMRISFEIAIHQGCRSTETCLPLSQIDLERMEITFNVKGGKTFTTKLNPDLVPLLSRLKSEGRERTFDLCSQAGREWTRFFRKIGLRHLCFHCTRVSVITRMSRANVSESQAMRFVGHASETIHRVYQRLRAEDVSACVSALRIPSSETEDSLPATPERAAESSSSQTRTDIRRPSSPTRTTAISVKPQPVPSQ